MRSGFSGVRVLGLSLLIGAGAVLGCLVAIALFVLAIARRQAAMGWLGGFVGAFSLLVVGDVLLQTGAIFEFPHWYLAFDFLVFWLGPLLYAYVYAMLGQPRRPWWRHALHFAPGLALQAFLLPALFVTADEKRALIVEDLQYVGEARGLDVVLIAALLAVAYALAALALMRRYWRKLEAEYSNLAHLQLRWLATLMAICVALWLLWMLALTTQLGWPDLVSQLGLLVAIVVMGVFGLRQPQLWRAAESRSLSDVANAAALPDAPTLRAPVEATERPKYAKAGVADTELEQIAQRLEVLMKTELCFLESELSLTELAGRLGVAPHTLSQVFSTQLGQSFFHYVNALRIGEVLRCFADRAYDDQSILQIALASGFASKATFNAAFKRMTGTTPSRSRAAQGGQGG